MKKKFQNPSSKFQEHSKFESRLWEIWNLELGAWNFCTQRRWT
jgi:hypothetical protein